MCHTHKIPFPNQLASSVAVLPELLLASSSWLFMNFSLFLGLPLTLVISLQDAGSQQIGFLLGSCGVSLALTSEVCLKGLPKTQNGEIIQFKGQ